MVAAPPASVVYAAATTMTRLASPLCLVLWLVACGGNNDEVPNEIAPSSAYASRCEAPRSGTSDVKGSQLDEKLWVRSWINDLYLWYREVPRADPKMFTTTIDYFDVLKTGVVTNSGKPKDQFHFTYKTSDWIALSQSGVEASYGAQWVLLASRPPRKLVVAYTEAGSPAAAAGIDRGTQVVTVDGADLQGSNDVDTLNNGLFPTGPNQMHTFGIIDPGGTTPRNVTLTSATVATIPVKNVITLPAPNDKVGYMLFNDHIATAEKGLMDAVNQLKTAGITDLVLDMRYNGGGYLAIASQLAYMIAGAAPTAGKTFEREMFNDKYTTTDPFGDPLTPTPFYTETLRGFPLPEGQALPTLDLRRVFVLTSSGTCSASEAVMNGLAGVDVEVIQIGNTTCGKPYGFFPQDNCSTTFFAIQFQGVNQKNFGDYADGFVPGGVFRGCTVADDFTHRLGDPAEARLAAALGYRANQTCPTSRGSEAELSDGMVLKSVWRQNRIMGHPSGPSGEP